MVYDQILYQMGYYFVSWAAMAVKMTQDIQKLVQNICNKNTLYPIILQLQNNSMMNNQSNFYSTIYAAMALKLSHDTLQHEVNQ